MKNKFEQYHLPLEQSLKHSVAYLESLGDREVDKGSSSNELRELIGVLCLFILLIQHK